MMKIFFENIISDLDNEEMKIKKKKIIQKMGLEFN